MFKFNETNINKGYLVCSNLFIKIPQQCNWRNSSVVVISFWHCTSVYLLFIPHAKWYNVHRSRDLKYRAVPYRPLDETISWGFSKNYESTILNQCHSKVEKSGRQAIGQHYGKSDLFCMISLTLTKSGDRGAGWFILKQNFTSKFLENWNINHRRLCLYFAGTFF